MEFALVLLVAVVWVGVAIHRHNRRVEAASRIYTAAPVPLVLPSDQAQQAAEPDFFGLPFSQDERPPGSAPPTAAELADQPPFDPRPRRRTISMAIRKGWDVEIVYCDQQGEWTSRLVTPEWLGGAKSGFEHGEEGYNKNLFGGYCHAREDERRFRLDRIRAIVVLSDEERDQRMYNVL